MGRRYSVNQALVAQNSTTANIMNLTSTAAIRPRIYDIVVGSTATPADNAAKFWIQRSTTAGTTPTTTITPQALDSADPAAVGLCNQGTYATPPTLTANTYLLQWSQNQRATFRWVAAPLGELVLPATASNGAALVNPSIGGAAVIYEWMLHFEE